MAAGATWPRIVSTTATQTFTNKTLTTPVISAIYKDSGKTKLMTLPNVASDTLCAIAATQTLTNKTLTSPTLTTPLLADGGTGLTITSANQTHAAPTATVPDIVDAADSFVMNDTAATLTNKTLTAPVVTSPDLTFGVTAHSYENGHADWTLSVAELKTFILTVSAADQAVNAIATPTAGKIYMVYNACGSNLTIKATGQTGVTIANTKTALVRGNGTDFVRCTADA